MTEARAIIVAKDEHQWHRERAHGIGASEIPAILGLDRFRDPYTLWAQRTGRLEREEMPLRVKAGLAMEPMVAKFFEDQEGVQVEDPGPYTIYRIPGTRYQCTPDVFVAGTTRPVQIKTGNAYQESTWKDGQSPVAYLAQVTYEMHVLGADDGYLVGFIGLNNLHVRHVQKNQHFVNTILPEVDKFWDMLQTDTPPPVDYSESAMETWKRLHSTATQDVIELDAGMAEIVADWERAKEKAKEAAFSVEQAKSKLTVAIGDAGAATIGDGVLLTLKETNRKGACRVAYEAAEQLAAANIDHKTTEPSTYRTLRRAKIK